MALSRITNPFLSSSGAGNASITSPAANTIAFSTTTSERMRLDSSGNLGIGTASPSQKLEVAGNVLLSNNQYFGVKDTTGAAVGFPIYTGSNDAIFGYLASGTTGISTYQFRSGNNVERMRIDSSGNMLLGTTNSFARLTVNGSISPVASVSSFWGLDFAPSASSGTYITIANNATYDIAAGSGMVFIFEDGGTVGLAQLACHYGATSVVWQQSTGYSNTSGTANKINFYYGPGVYRIQNLTGSSKSIWVTLMRMRTSS